MQDPAGVAGVTRVEFFPAALQYDDLQAELSCTTRGAQAPKTTADHDDIRRFTHQTANLNGSGKCKTAK
jgi:hypothetical protein